jgi:serine phosphatase RsbU (regulator of sigma subunit)
MEGLNFKHAPVNLARVLLMVLVSLVSYHYNFTELYFLSLTLGFFSLLYLVIETRFNLTDRIPHLSYFVTGIDLAFILSLVYATGMNSFLLGGLIYATAITTENSRIKQGKFSIIFSFAIHSILIILLYYGLIPYLDIFQVDPVPNKLNILIAFLTIHIVNYLVYSIVKSLRTDLINRNNELELERNKLFKSYTSLDTDLNIARKIQGKLIPTESPLPFLHSLYYPMMHVGGDFFDFVKFRDPDKIGIFLSDVSGHGVPAAFITTMIKTSIFQSGEKKENPKALLAYLNDVLYEQTGGFFITAFYGIFNRSDCSLLYSNAGHDWPLVIGQEKINSLTGSRSAPIGIFSNEELELRAKSFENSIQTMLPEERILFFTDGVTEVRKLGGLEPYLDEAGFFEILNKIRAKRGQAFVNSLFQALVSFRGSDQFEDDLLILSLECNRV